MTVSAGTRRILAVALPSLVAVSACTASDDGATIVPGTDPSPTSPTSTAPPTAMSTTSTTSTTSTSVSPSRTYDFSEIGPIVQQVVDEQGLNGAGLVIVERDDGIVHEEYWGEFDADRVSLVASASKMIVAGVLMRLDDRGLLDVDAPVADAVDWGSGNPDITPAQLLSNSSGLVGLGPNPAFPPYLCQFLPEGDLEDCATTIFTTTADDADVIAPDTEYRYGGGQWQVAGGVAEAVSGSSWADLVEETYVEPCGVDSLGFGNHWTQFRSLGFDYPPEFAGDPSTLADTANPNMEGGAYITAPDYARLLLMHLRDGRCDDRQVLSPGALERMHADRIGEVYGGSSGGDGGYGLGWLVDRETGLLTDPGAYGAVTWLDLDDGHGAYLVVEADVGTGVALAESLAGPVAEAVAAARAGS